MKKYLIVLIATVLLIAIPSNASAYEVKELKTECIKRQGFAVDDCETTLLFDNFKVAELLDYQQNIDKRMIKKKSVSIKDNKRVSNTITFESFDWISNSVTIKGTIKLGSSNYWGIEDVWNSTYWNSSYPYAMNLTFNNSANANALDGFVIFVNVTHEPSMNDNFTDVVFVNDSVFGDENAIELNYFWIKIVDGLWAIAGVKVDTLPAVSYRNVSMYYGSNYTTSTSNGTNTFHFFDHFTVFDLSKWLNSTGTPTTSNSIIEVPAQTSIRTVNNYRYNTLAGGNCSFEFNPSGFWTGWGWNYLQDTERAMFFLPNGNNYSNTRTSGSESNTQISKFSVPVDSYGWKIFEIKRPSSDDFVEFWIDFGLESNHSANIPTRTDQGLTFINHPSGDSGVSIFCDWVFIANNTDPFPTYFFGTEQTNETPPAPPVIVGDFTLIESYYCSGNNSVFNQTYTNATGDYLTNTTLTVCDNGCDPDNLIFSTFGNRPSLCNPPVWLQAIIFIIVLIVLGYLVWRFS